MQCPSCRAVYSNGLDLCPRCKTPAAKAAPESISNATRPAPETRPHPAGNVRGEATGSVAPEVSVEAAPVTATTAQATAPAAQATASTLIEFPGAGRARPQWRKELSERVREIQERRARDAEREAAEAPRIQREALEAARIQEAARVQIEQPEPAVPQLGLVPQPDAPAVNPIVAAALKRIERARQPPISSRVRTGGGGAATAVARVAEEQIEDETTPEDLAAPMQMATPAPAPVQAARAEALPEKTLEQVREHNLIMVQTPPLPRTIPKAEPLASAALPAAPQPKRIFAEAVDESFLDRLEEEQAPVNTEQPYDDRAPVLKRFAGGFIDLLVVAFASTPFAAIIELTNGNWTDPRVAASMGGIILLVMFLYLTASTALAGRTWGMSLVSVRAVDADTGNFPSTWQAVGRALLYMASLATLGLGLLYALFNAEGRALHDLFSRTAVVRE